MIVIGHRGAPAEAPENTMAAFEAAWDAGADAIETDVRITRDGSLILSHDDGWPGGGRISEMTLSELRTRGNVVVLEELLAIAAGRPLFLECKGVFTVDRFVSAEPAARAMVPLLAGVPDVTVSSFDPSAIATVRALAPTLPVGLGCADMFPPQVIIDLAASSGYEQVHPSDSVVTPDVVTAARGVGVDLFVWTVNDAARAIALREMGVAGVFTDDPRRIREALG